MRWLLLAALVGVAVVEGLIIINWPLLGVKLPLSWICLYLVLANQWVGWKQGLVMTAICGLLLDELAAPAAGAVLGPLVAAWLLAAGLLAKLKYSRTGQWLALLAGSTVYLLGSFMPGAYWPGPLLLLVYLAVYWLVTMASYALVSMVAQAWLRRV